VIRNSDTRRIRKLSAPLAWQPIGTGLRTPEKSGKRQSITALLPGISWPSFVTSTCGKVERSTLREGCNLEAIQDGIEKFLTEIVIDDMVMVDSMPQNVKEALDFQKAQ
jgi:hypothetical protein